MRALGARLVEAPATSFDEARAWLLARRAELPGELPSAADEAAIMAGGGSVALEVLEAAPAVEDLLVPAGWGGLAIGCAVAQDDARVWAVNSDASPGLHAWLHHGRAPRPDEERPTWAEGIQGGTTARTGRLARARLAGALLAREETVRRAVRELLLRERLLVEPSGAAGVAALLDGAAPPGQGTLAVVLTGGNVDPERLRGLLG
jgi:threonine dehydratase